MTETKPRINRGNRGQLFRASWLSSARCNETFRRTTERVECSAKCTWQRPRTGLNLFQILPTSWRHLSLNTTATFFGSFVHWLWSRHDVGRIWKRFRPVRGRCHVHLARSFAVISYFLATLAHYSFTSNQLCTQP